MRRREGRRALQDLSVNGPLREMVRPLPADAERVGHLRDREADGAAALEQRPDLGAPAPLFLGRALGRRALRRKPGKNRVPLVLQYLLRLLDVAHVNVLYTLTTSFPAS